MKFAYVKWIDACSVDTEIREENIPREMIMETAGILVKSDHEGVIIAQDLLDDGRYRQTISIPKLYIKKKKILK